MWLPLRLYLGFNRLLGLHHTPYNSSTGRFVGHHLAWIVYTLLLHMIYLIGLPLASGLLLATYKRCERFGINGHIIHTIVVAKICTAVVIICGIWLRRRRLLRLANSVARICRQFQREIMESRANRAQLAQCLHICIIKWCTSGCRFLMFTFTFFGYSDELKCNMTEQDMGLAYMASILFLLHMELLTMCVDCNIFVCQAFGNMLLGILSQQLRELCNDLRLFSAFSGCQCHDRVHCHHALWLWQLQRALAQFMHRQRAVHALDTELLSIFQGQILIALFVSFLTGIVLMFRILAFIYRNGFSNYKMLLLYFVVLVLYYFAITLRFDLFEVKKRRWQHIRLLYYELWLHLQTLRDCRRGRILLDRSLEFAILDLNRQLQIDQRRVRRLHIAGLFDLDNRSSLSMSKAMVTNMLVLCQIVVAQMYKWQL